MDESTGNRVDSIGTNTLTNSFAAADVSGVINGAVKFLGDGGHLIISDNTSVRVSSDFTFSLWVNMLSNSNVGTILAKAQQDFAAFDYLIWNTGTSGASGGFQFSVLGSPSGISLFTGTTPTTGVWYHLVCWYDSSDGKLRIRVNDTTTYVSSASLSSLTQSANPFTIGSLDFGVYPSNCIVDEVGFWKRVLTPTEITLLYNGGVGYPLSSFGSGGVGAGGGGGQYVLTGNAVALAKGKGMSMGQGSYTLTGQAVALKWGRLNSNSLAWSGGGVWIQ